MALDKLVDSAQLDAGMTYTANRIRAKTGDNALISWDSVKGFGDAIDSIQTGGGGVTITKTKIGQTPTMTSANNQNSSNLCTVDVDGLDYDAILFITADKTEYKLVPYLPSTIASQSYGLLQFTGTSAYESPSTAVSFGIAARDSTDVTTLTITHGRMTGTAGGWYGAKNAAFDIYAVKMGVTNW